LVNRQRNVLIVKGQGKSMIEGENTMANRNRIGRLISILIAIAFGTAGYFYVKDTLVKTGQENLIPLLTAGIIVAIPIAAAIVHWEDKLMSIKPINITVTFFKRTQWLWFAAIVIGIIVLYST